jgi:hypothetical protein
MALTTTQHLPTLIGKTSGEDLHRKSSDERTFGRIVKNLRRYSRASGDPPGEDWHLAVWNSSRRIVIHASIADG